MGNGFSLKLLAGFAVIAAGAAGLYALHQNDQLQAQAQQAAQLQNQLQAQAQQAAQLQNQLQQSQSKLVAEVRPDLPVSLSFRKAMLNAGQVAMIRNTSDRELEITVDVESPVTGQHLRRAVVINPNGLWEFGAHEGWPFAPGQRIMLNNPQYRPIVQTVGG